MPETKRPLKVFLCHASADKQKVRELYRYLRRRGIKPWFDEMDLVGGQDWQVEIPKALSTSDAIIICLTKNSVDKEGYIQKEIKFALDKALEMPEGRIFLIPVRFEECEVPFSLSRYQWVDLFDDAGYARMMRALKLRAAQLQRSTVELPKKDTDEGKVALDRAAREQEEREATEKATREKIEREKMEKAARDKLEHEAVEKAKQEKIEREAAEKATREKVERGAAENVAREKAEREKLERETAEKAAREKEEREKAEKAAQEKLQGEAAKRVRKVEVERKAAETAMREKAKRDAAEKAKQEQAKRLAAQITALKETLAKSFNTLRSAIPKMMPFLRIGGVIGIILVLLWLVPPMMPSLLAFVPTSQPSATVTYTSSPSISTITPTMSSTLTLTPTKTSTPTLTPTPTPVPPDRILFQKDFEDGRLGELQPIDEDVWTLEQDPDGNHSLCGTGPSKNPPQIWYRDRRTLWTDYAFETHVKFIQGNTLYIIFRNDLGSNEFYGVALNDYGLGLMRSWKGLLGSSISPMTPDPDRWYIFKVQIKGDSLSVYLDNLLFAKLILQPPVINQGGIGYVTDATDKVCLDDIKVWSLK